MRLWHDVACGHAEGKTWLHTGCCHLWISTQPAGEVTHEHQQRRLSLWYAWFCFVWLLLSGCAFLHLQQLAMVWTHKISFMFVWPLDLLLVFKAFCITLSLAFCLDLENISVNSFWFRYDDKLRRGFPCCQSLNISADQIVTIFHAKNLKRGCHVFWQTEALQQNWSILNETFKICNYTYSLMMRDIGCDQRRQITNQLNAESYSDHCAFHQSTQSTTWWSDGKLVRK